MSDQLNEETHTREILRQAGVDVPETPAEIEAKKAKVKKAAAFDAEAVDGDKDGVVQDGTLWERPVGTQPEGFDVNAVDGDKDGLVQDGTVFERDVKPVAVEPATTEAVVIAEPEPVVVVAAPAPAAKRNKSKKAGADFSSVPTELTANDVVSLQRLIFENIYSQNSASVIAVQKRLIECGFITAGDENAGYMSVGTREALQDFVAEIGVEAVDDAGLVTEEVIKALFLGTPVSIIA